METLIKASDARRAILKEAPHLAYIIDNLPGANAVEIPNCKDCAFDKGIAYWHQCENCIGQSTNNFTHKGVIEDG